MRTPNFDESAHGLILSFQDPSGAKRKRRGAGRGEARNYQPTEIEFDHSGPEPETQRLVQTQTPIKNGQPYTVIMAWNMKRNRDTIRMKLAKI